MTVHPSQLPFALREALGFSEAQCLYDAELHTAPHDSIESPEQKTARHLVAAEVCLACPVMAQCLDRAISGTPESGIWGTFDAEVLRSLFADDIAAGLNLGEVA